MKRTLLLGSAWTASAAAAVGLGFLAISLVDASASTDRHAVTASLTALTGPETAAPSAPTQAPAPVPAGQQVTAGGTVYGSCADGVPVLASAPAAGWWLDGSSDAGEVEFGNGTQQIQVHLTCVGGTAQFTVEGPRAHDSSGHGSDDVGSSAPSASTTVPSAPTAAPPVDDSDGRSGGGHGSDDGPGTPAPSAATGDDSDGRSGGGHGSDD
jgi:hypothetical protein